MKRYEQLNGLLGETETPENMALKSLFLLQNTTGFSPGLASLFACAIASYRFSFSTRFVNNKLNRQIDRIEREKRGNEPVNVIYGVHSLDNSRSDIVSFVVMITGRQCSYLMFTIL